MSGEVGLAREEDAGAMRANLFPVRDGDGDGIVVFTPSPLLTVALEPGMTEYPEIHLHAGGQGFWVARMVARLGMPVTLVGPFGGETGAALLALVQLEDITVRPVDALLANGAYIQDHRTGERLAVAESPSPKLTRHEMDELYGAALVAGLRSRVTVLTGPTHEAVIDADVYRRLAIDLRSNGVVVVADLSGPELRAALAGGIDLLKVNHEEVRACGLVAPSDVDDPLRCLTVLVASGARNVILSRGAETPVAYIDGCVLEIVGPRFEPLDYHGSGDSMTAALAVGLATGMGVEETLRLAAAAGAINVTRRGLGTGTQREIRDLTALITVRTRMLQPNS